MAGRDIEPQIVQRLVTVLAVLVVGFLLGRMIIMSPELAAGGLVMAFIVLGVLMVRPFYFVLIMLFFFLQAFDIFDVDAVSRIPGLFRGKDIFLVLLVGYLIVNLALHHLNLTVARRSRITPWLMLFLGFILMQFLRTVYLLDESPILAFRQGRQFIVYSFPLLLATFFRSEKAWDKLDRFFILFIMLTTFLNVLVMAGVYIPYYRTSTIHVGKLGIFKSYNPIYLMVFWMFCRQLWLTTHDMNRKNLLWMAFFVFVYVFYPFRGYLVALVLSMGLVLFFVSGGVRIRVVILGALLLFTLIAGVLTWDVVSGKGLEHVEKVSTYFVSTVTDVVRDEGTYAQRKELDSMRYPLVRRQPLLGYGFVSPFGMAYRMWRTEGVLAIETTDTGWLDLMIRFGFIGAVLLGALIFAAWRVNYRLLRHPGIDLKTRATLLANLQFFTAMVLMVITAAPFTVEFNIVMVSLVIMRTMYLEHQICFPQRAGSNDTVHPAA